MDTSSEDESDEGFNEIIYRPNQGMGKAKIVKEKQKKEDKHQRPSNLKKVEEQPVHLRGEERVDWDNNRTYQYEWWLNEGVTREDVMRYLRALAPETTPDDDDSPDLNADLADAAAGGDVEEIRSLLEEGAQVNAGGAGGSSQQTALHHAAREGKTEAVEALLDAGARVNVRTWGRWTALHFASAKDNAALVALLLSRHADMYAVNADGQTPFDVAGGDVASEALKAGGYNAMVAANCKKAVSFIAPQLPRSANGYLPNINLVCGRGVDAYRKAQEPEIQRTPGSDVVITDLIGGRELSSEEPETLSSEEDGIDRDLRLCPENWQSWGLSDPPLPPLDLADAEPA